MTRADHIYRARAWRVIIALVACFWIAFAGVVIAV